MRTERWIKTLRSEMLAKVDHSGCLICWNGMPYHVTRIIHHFNYHGSSGLVLRWFMFHQLHKRYMYIIQKWFFGVVSCCFQVSGFQLHVSCIIYLHSSFFFLSFSLLSCYFFELLSNVTAQPKCSWTSLHCSALVPLTLINAVSQTVTSEIIHQENLLNFWNRRLLGATCLAED